MDKNPILQDFLGLKTWTLDKTPGLPAGLESWILDTPPRLQDGLKSWLLERTPGLQDSLITWTLDKTPRLSGGLETLILDTTPRLQDFLGSEDLHSGQDSKTSWGNYIFLKLGFLLSTSRAATFQRQVQLKLSSS